MSAELDQLETKVTRDLKVANDWYTAEMAKLREQRDAAKSRIDALAAEAKSELDDVKAEADRHWQALQAAVKTYREKVESDVSSS